MRTFAQKQKPTPEANSASSARPGGALSGQACEVSLILQLQRSIGNQAAARLLQAQAQELGDESRTSALPRFGHGFSRIPVHAGARMTIQEKLQVNTLVDTHEQQADRIAEQVMHMPEPDLQRTGSGYHKCQNELAAHEHLQTKPVQANDSVEKVVPPIVDKVLHSSGQPLDPSMRAFFEPRFGHDFSQVRVHTDAQAAESAAAVNALAYTVGRDMVFRVGQYQPETTAGKRLLAHELTHVVQQANGFQTKLVINQPWDQYEREADRTELAITRGAPPPIYGKTSAGVMRQLMKQQTEKPESTPEPVTYGPYLIPEVVITARANNLQAVRDVTFVKVETGEEALQRMKILNQQAEEELEERWRRAAEESQGTISDASPEAALKVKQDADRKAQETLKNQFGEFWGTFFWWTRGGGQTGEDSPLWKILPAARGFNRGYPPPAFPTQKPVYKDTRGTATPTESTK